MGRIVFTNGCFDLLHVGHLHTLKFAASLCDRGEFDQLIVGLNSDESVASIKPKGRPIISDKHRKMMLEALPFVDRVIIFHEDTPYELMKKLGLGKSDVVVKGPDYAHLLDDPQGIVAPSRCEVVCAPEPSEDIWLDGDTTQIIIRCKQCDL